MADLFSAKKVYVPGLTDGGIDAQLAILKRQNQDVQKVSLPPDAAYERADQIIRDASELQLPESTSVLPSSPTSQDRLAATFATRAAEDAPRAGLISGAVKTALDYNPVFPGLNTALEAIDEAGTLTDRESFDATQQNIDDAKELDKTLREDMKTRQELRQARLRLTDEQAREAGYPPVPRQQVLVSAGQELLADVEQMKASQERIKQAEENIVTQTWWLNGAQVATKSMARIGTGMLATPPIIWEQVRDFYNLDKIVGGGRSDARAWVDAVDASLEQMLPGDKAQAKNLASELSSAGGSFLGYMLAGYASGMAGLTGKISTAQVGAMVGASQGFREAERFGATETQQTLHLILGAGLGATEAFPIDRMLFRANQATGGLGQRLLRNARFGSLEEFIQEFSQAAGEDIVAKYGIGFGTGYDKERELDVFDWAKQGAIGGVIGGAGGAASTLIARGEPGYTTQEQQLMVDKAIALMQTRFDEILPAAVDTTTAVEIEPGVTLEPVDTSKPAQEVQPDEVQPVDIPTEIVESVERPELDRPEFPPQAASQTVLPDAASPVETGEAVLPVDASSEVIEAKVTESVPYAGGSMPAPRSDGKIELTHWARVPRTVLDPTQMGTGPFRGQERARLVGPEAVPRTYYGVNATTDMTPENSTALQADLKAAKKIKNSTLRNEAEQAAWRKHQRQQGYIREAENLGNARHVVAVEPDRLYNWYEDPLGLKAQLDRTKPGSEQMTDYERLIRDAGFAGYYVSEGPQGQTVALFEAATPERIVDERTGQDLMTPPDDEAEFEARRELTSPEAQKKLLDQVPGLKGVLKHLTPEERANVTKRNAPRLVELFESMPDAKEMAAVAISGRAKRGWYANSARALVDIFGMQDAPRFTALLAALSPQTSVESNTVNALKTWVNWDKAGRPQDRKTILKIMGQSVEGGGTEASVLDAWKNNSIRALTAPDPTAIQLSGPKVDSFMRNLWGVTSEVTNDAWLANFANIDQDVFRGSEAGRDDVASRRGKSTGYVAMSAAVRAAAESATRITGDTWTPAEIQETVWSWAKTLYETAGSGMSALEVLNTGGLTSEAIGAMPDFATLFTTGAYRAILEAGGYNVENITGGGRADVAPGDPRNVPEGATIAPDAFGVQLRRAARRLDQLRARRAREAAAAESARTGRTVTAPQQLDEDDLPQATGEIVEGGIPFDGAIIPMFSQSAVDDELFDDPFAEYEATVVAKPDLTRLPGLPKSSTGPIESVVRAARAYADSIGLPVRRQKEYVKADPERGARIAKAYEKMQHNPEDPAVKAAFQAMIDETLAQYQFVKASGLQIEAIEPAFLPDPELSAFNRTSEAAKAFDELYGRTGDAAVERAVRIRGKTYRGPTHADALEAAKEERRQERYAAGEFYSDTLYEEVNNEIEGANPEFGLFTTIDPYPGGPKEVLEDLQNGHLWFFPTESGFGGDDTLQDTEKSVLREGGSTLEYQYSSRLNLAVVLELDTPVSERGRGQARRLMETLLRRADAAGARVELMALPDADTSKRRLVGFYQRLGFKKFGVDDGGVLMRRAPRRNPLLAPTNEFIGDRQLLANDVFRIVHDFFGHGMEGAGFGATGEENAWQSHMRLYTEAALPAVTSETRGQNSWVNFGPYGEQNRANQRETVYADQKTGLMPSWTWTEGVADDSEFEAQRAATGPVTPADFASPTAETFRRPGWAIVTAMREEWGGTEDPRNQAALQQLREELKGTGAIEVQGAYQGVPQGASWIVFMPPRQALEIGRRYGQESVLTNKGLEYTDGRLVPAVHDQTVVGDAARQQDFFSTLPSGESFSVGLDFGGEEAAVGTGGARGPYKGEQTRPAKGVPTTPQNAGAGSDGNLLAISRNFIKLMNLTARQGRFTLKGSDVMGQYSSKQGVVRLRSHSDLSTLVHEGGHALHDAMAGPLKSFVGRWEPEIIKVGLDNYGGDLTGEPKAKQIREGFAEFVRLYTLNRGYAATNYPGLTADFATLLQTEAPQLDVGLDLVGKQFQAYLMAPSVEVMRNNIVPGIQPAGIRAAVKAARGQLPEGVQARGFAGTIQELKDRGFTTWMHEFSVQSLEVSLNRFAPLSSLVTDLLNQAQQNRGSSLDLKRADDPYTLARLAPNFASRAFVQMNDGIIPYRSTTPASASLRDAILISQGFQPGDSPARFDEAKLLDFDAYLASLRIIDEYRRLAEDKLDRPPVRETLGDAQLTAKEMLADNPQFAKAAQMVHEFAMAMWQKQFDAGLMDKETYQEGLDHQFYVPLQRDMSDKQSLYPDNALTSARYLAKRFKGSDRKIVSPTAVLMHKLHSLERAIAENDVKVALAQLAEKAGTAGALVERVPATQMIGQTYTVKEIARRLADDPNLSATDASDLLTILAGSIQQGGTISMFRSQDANAAGEHIVFYFDKGKLAALQLKDGQIGADVVNLLNGLGRENLPLGMELIAGTSQVYRSAITSWPDFLIVNYVRDQMQAWILSTVGFKPFVTGFKGMTEEVRQRQWARSYNAAMGIMGGMNVAAMHRSRMNRDIDSLRADGYFHRAFGEQGFSGALKGFARLMELSETGTRVGLFKLAYERGKADGLTDYEASVEAAYLATDYMDFGLNGNRMLFARRTIPFLNAQLQGLYKMMRVLGADEARQRKGLKFVLKAYFKSTNGMDLSRTERLAVQTGRAAWVKMVGIGMFSALLHFIFEDDPDYQRASDYLRQTNWVIPVGDGRIITIPKPFELALLANAIERGLETASGDPTAKFRFLRGAALSLLPPGSPPAIQTIVELQANYDFFTGRQITPDYMQALDPVLRYDAYTSELAKAMSEAIGGAAGLSPLVLEHIMSGLGASAYRDVTNMTNMMDPDRPTMPWTDMMVLRRFFRDSRRGSTTSQDFWKQAGQLDGKLRSAEVTYKRYLESGNEPAANRFLGDVSQEEAAYAILTTHFKTDAKRLNPFYRGAQVGKLLSAMNRELISDLGLENTDKYADEPSYKMTAGEKAKVRDLLTEISDREMRNTMVATGAPGWEGRAFMPVEPTMRMLEYVSPRAYEELIRRLDKAKVYDAQAVFDSWPEVRNRLLTDREGAYLDDIISGAKAYR